MGTLKPAAMARQELLLLLGLCVLTADAFAPGALPTGLRLRTAVPSLCAVQASAEDMSRRNFLSSAAVAAVGLSLPRNAEAKKAPVEEEEEEEEEQTTPAAKFRTEADGAKKRGKDFSPKAAKSKMYQGNTSGDSSSVSVGMGGLIVKAVAVAGVVGGGALTAQKVAGKYGSDAKKMVDTKEGVPIKFGFTTSSEIWNGRLAMVGFVGILVLELFTGRGLLL